MKTFKNIFVILTLCLISAHYGPHFYYSPAGDLLDLIVCSFGAFI